MGINFHTIADTLGTTLADLFRTSGSVNLNRVEIPLMKPCPFSLLKVATKPMINGSFFPSYPRVFHSVGVVYSVSSERLHVKTIHRTSHHLKSSPLAHSARNHNDYLLSCQLCYITWPMELSSLGSC